MFNKKEYLKQWQKDNPEKVKEHNKQYRKDNSEYGKQWRKNNPEYMKQWCKNNPEYINQWHKNKRETDIKYNLNRRISGGIYLSLKNGKAGKHWESLVNYTLTDLIKRLKKTIPGNYTWDNYLAGDLHIDHIIPISAFNFDNSENLDFQNCWALNNLQLLPAKENLIKHNKITRPFQPALQLS